ncbi:MAG: hypothetical protein JJT96_06270 [Opitutales bacterium]|nr:hypothetical protein [Opitutales bacterium]
MDAYGHFSPDGREYIITTPHPPRDWFNYLWNDTYLASVAQNLNGNALHQNEAGVLTNFLGKQDALGDPRAVYIRDRETGEFWSAAYYPCHTDFEEFECRHGLGYTLLRTVSRGIEVRIRIFVPRNHNGEVWSVTLHNRSGRPRELSVFTACNVMLDGINLPYGYISGLRAQPLPDEHLFFFSNTTHTVVNERYRAFVYADRRPDHWEVGKRAFVGKYRCYERPESVEHGLLGDGVASVEHLVGALQHDFSLGAGDSAAFHRVQGIVLDLAEARAMRDALADETRVESEFTATREACLERLGRFTLDSPNKDLNCLANTWMKHQMQLMGDWARFYFKGYRDTCQDAAGISIIDPCRGLTLLKKALRNQRSDGFCPRAFRVASMDIAAADKHYADSPSWISHAVDALLRETGDLSLLDETVPYSDKGEGSVWEHILRAMEFLWNDRGAHGLSLIHYGDWNDLMDKVGTAGRGQSVWMSFALARVLRLTGEIARWKGDTATAILCDERFGVLKNAIFAHGWDGDYFIYAINDDGLRIGTHTASEGKVFLNPQSWAHLSGVIDAATYEAIMQKVEPIVDTPVGPVHNWPAFTQYHPGIGQLSGTPPGFFTNGNVYCHAAAFKVAADFEAGRTEKAFDTFMSILPSPERSEPYAQVNGYIGPSALRAEHHVSEDPWRTGTVAWNWLNLVDRLLGFRRSPEGFELKPQIPAAWEGVRYTRPFRGTDFHIHICRGSTAAFTVDGKTRADPRVEVPANGLAQKEVHIKMTLPRR